MNYTLLVRGYRFSPNTLKMWCLWTEDNFSIVSEETWRSLAMKLPMYPMCYPYGQDTLLWMGYPLQQNRVSYFTLLHHRQHRYQYPKQPQAPYDLRIKHQEWRQFMSSRTATPQSKFDNAYYHCQLQCVIGDVPYTGDCTGGPYMWLYHVELRSCTFRCKPFCMWHAGWRNRSTWHTHFDLSCNRLGQLLWPRSSASLVPTAFWKGCSQQSCDIGQFPTLLSWQELW